MNKFDREHAHNIAAYQKRVQDILNEYEKDITSLASAITIDGDRPFSFSDYPALKDRYNRLIRDLAAELNITIENGEKVEWGRADAKNDALAVGYTGSIANAALAGYIARNNEALEAFATRKVNGLDLSGRVWRITDQFSTEIQDAIDISLRDHLTADELSREVRRYLKNPDALFRRVRDEHGNLHLSKRAKAYHPGQGVYRSAYMNARRLAATEINMAYRTSDHMRQEKLDFVVGIEVHLSNNHNCKGVPPGQFYDICDELQGKYPKDFKFTGWHPLCYDDKSEVYTDSGWKLFKDVKDSDLILSLNPETRDLEYTGILLNISRPYKGKMVHFHNRSYSQLVTPEHEVLYVSKNDGRTFKRMSAEKCGKSQPIYRSSEWKGEKHNAIEIGTKKLDFLLFARFMGYWLSDGSLGHKYSVSIAQQDANRENIYKCINEMGFRARYNGGKVEFNDQSFYEYLLRFGKAADKYVPQEIKEGTAEEIRAFLYAFISCDGHISEPKPFIGNRGSICIPSEGEKTYSTTSRRMADDIGELILKTGRRPSFSVQRTAGKTQRFHNGTYTINHDIITIRECRSLFATQYSKDYVDYDGMVYDLTLAKNNTMYIRRDGKCFWGSNCRCYTTTILKTREEMREDTRRRLKGEQPSKDSVNSVKELPDNFKKWLEDNGERIQRAKSLPYFLKDNGARNADGVWKPFIKTVPAANTTTPKTQSNIGDIIDAAEKYGIKKEIVKKAEKILSSEDIINKISGGDKTKGSCSSLALTYAGNKAGFDVEDFRGGGSQEFFSRNGNIRQIVEKAGGVTESQPSDLKSGSTLLLTLEEGKEYYFACGRHAAIVRKNEGVIEYLELQSSKENGWKPFGKDTLKTRFGAKRSHTFYGRKYNVESVLLDIEKLKNDPRFNELLEYINTAAGEQKKGVSGGIK